MSTPQEILPSPVVADHYGGQLLRGSLWMIGARWVIRMLGMVSALVLARLLSPEDFGLVAMVMLAYGLLETISYAGADLALLRTTVVTRQHLDTAWTVQILQGGFIAALLLLSSPAVALYFSEPRVLTLVAWVALRAVIDGLQNIGVVAFRKELDFAREFRFTVFTKIASVIMVVIAAVLLRSYWALVIGSLLASVMTVVISYVMHPYRPRLSLSKASELWSFSQWLMVSRVGSYLNRKCDEMVVGGYVGTSAMGSYHVASDIATLPSSEIVMPVRRAMFPTLATVTQNPQEFGRAVLASFSAIAALCLFVGTCLMVTAPEFVGVILGAKWLNAVVIFRWLAIFGGLSAMVLVLEVPIWVSGRTSMSAMQTWLELAAIAPLSWIAVRLYGMEGAAAARVLVAAAMVPLMMVLTARIGAVSFGQLLAAVWRPCAAAVVMGLVVSQIPALGGAFVMLIVKVAACLVAYPSALLALWRVSGRPDGFEASALDEIARRLARLR